MRWSLKKDIFEKDQEMDARFVYVTCKDEVEAMTVGKGLVEARLAACANVLPGMKSVYWWKGEVVTDQECVLILKSRAGCMENLILKVKELHSYSIPCVVSIPILEGNQDYLDWIAEETGA